MHPQVLANAAMGPSECRDEGLALWKASADDITKPVETPADAPVPPDPVPVVGSPSSQREHYESHCLLLPPVASRDCPSSGSQPESYQSH